MRTKSAGGAGLYDPNEEIVRCEKQLAEICLIVGMDWDGSDSLRIDHLVVNIRKHWQYSSAVTSLLKGATRDYLAKTNFKLTTTARHAYWNLQLAKAVRDGQ